VTPTIENIDNDIHIVSKDVITLAIADWIAIDNYKIDCFLNGYD